MRQNARPLFCIAAIALLAGCGTRMAELRPVAPVVEARSMPVTTRAASPQSSQNDSNSDSGVERQPASDSAHEGSNTPGVRVEAIIPGIYSGRSLSFEKMDRSGQIGPAAP
jgi:hypothetical protein